LPEVKMIWIGGSDRVPARGSRCISASSITACFASNLVLSTAIDGVPPVPIPSRRRKRPRRKWSLQSGTS
jgi:hypothetical protein